MEYLRLIAEFTVRMNYLHHTANGGTIEIEDKIESVYLEEQTFSSESQIYIVEDKKENMIGCIRVMKWNKTDLLPVQRLFNINPLNCIERSYNSTYWHVGRFAVDSRKEIPAVSLFKQLMLYAINPIYQEPDGYMIAECDSKLLRVMNLLGIKTVNLGKSICYLGSETIPVYADKKGLATFYLKYSEIYNIGEDMHRTLRVA
jgi:N-acyl-L-homoserine lactone synthetase